jgi:hypothetical protein
MGGSRLLPRVERPLPSLNRPHEPGTRRLTCSWRCQHVAYRLNHQIRGIQLDLVSTAFGYDLPAAS